MLGTRSNEILVAVGEIIEVVQRADRAVFLRVELRHYGHEDGEPLEGLCRLLVPYHGASFGDWHVPTVGVDVLCFFPGIGPDGVPGGDLDAGYAFGFVSSVQEPPQDGQVGPLSPTRRVYRGQAGVDHDLHLQGNLDALVTGNDTSTVQGNATRTVQGNESKTVQGTEDTETVGVLTRIGRALMAWRSDVQVDVEAPVVRLGDLAATVYELVDQRFVALYNGHTHSGGAVPDQQASIGSQTTTRVKAN